MVRDKALSSRHGAADSDVLPDNKQSSDSPNHCRAATHALSFRHRDLNVWRQQHIRTRAELDHTETLAQPEIIALPFPANHSPREYARNLLAHNRNLLALNGQRILFVDETGLLVRRHQKLARRINHVDDLARNGRAIDVNVEWRKEDTDHVRA